MQNRKHSIWYEAIRLQKLNNNNSLKKATFVNFGGDTEKYWQNQKLAYTKSKELPWKEYQEIKNNASKKPAKEKQSSRYWNYNYIMGTLKALPDVTYEYDFDTSNSSRKNSISEAPQETQISRRKKVRKKVTFMDM